MMALSAVGYPAPPALTGFSEIPGNVRRIPDFPGATLMDSQNLFRALLRYREPDHRRAVLELGVTLGALALCWLAMWWSLSVGYWLTLLLAVPAAGFLVRLFMIQHDCGHGAFFRYPLLNDWVGRALGVLTLTPYDYWKRNHVVHHATSANLDRRGIGDIETLTVAEYRARPLAG